MNEKSKYYQIDETEESLILNDRVEIDWKQILLYPIPLAIVVFFLAGNNVFLALGFAIVFGLLFLLFRYSAWLFYKELRINKSSGKVQVIQKLLNKVTSNEQIDSSFNHEAIQFEKHERSGKTNYILQYVTHKTNNILVVKSESDRNEIENRLAGIKTNHNTM